MSDGFHIRAGSKSIISHSNNYGHKGDVLGDYSNVDSTDDE